MYNILIALRLWGDILKSRSVVINCDNYAVVSSLNSGRGRDHVLLAIARNVWLVAAQFDIDIAFTHIPGKLNVTADLLSRWYSSGVDRSKLSNLIEGGPRWYTVTSASFVY